MQCILLSPFNTRVNMLRTELGVNFSLLVQLFISPSGKSLKTEWCLWSPLHLSGLARYGKDHLQWPPEIYGDIPDALSRYDFVGQGRDCVAVAVGFFQLYVCKGLRNQNKDWNAAHYTQLLIVQQTNSESLMFPHFNVCPERKTNFLFICLVRHSGAWGSDLPLQLHNGKDLFNY